MMKNLGGLVLIQLLACTEGWLLLPATRTATWRLLAQTYSRQRDQPTFLSTDTTTTTDESNNNSNSDIASRVDNEPSTSQRRPAEPRRCPQPLQDDNDDFSVLE